MDKGSGHYLRSTYSIEMSGDNNGTTYERDLKVSGNNPTDVRVAAEWIRGKVMP